MADEEKEVKAETEEKPAKKSSKLLIIILLVGGLVIGGGGAAAFLVLKNMNADEKSEVAEENSSKEESDAEKANDMLGPIKSLDPFIVNLAGAGGRNYLKIEITLEFDKEGVDLEVDNKMPMIKDSILLLLASKSFDSIQSAEGKLMLKNEMILRLNKFLTTGDVQNLYFTNFVVQ